MHLLRDEFYSSLIQNSSDFRFYSLPTLSVSLIEVFSQSQLTNGNSQEKSFIFA